MPGSFPKEYGDRAGAGPPGSKRNSFLRIIRNHRIERDVRAGVLDGSGNQRDPAGVLYKTGDRTNLRHHEKLYESSAAAHSFGSEPARPSSADVHGGKHRETDTKRAAGSRNEEKQKDPANRIVSKSKLSALFSIQKQNDHRRGGCDSQ